MQDPRLFLLKLDVSKIVKLYWRLCSMYTNRDGLRGHLVESEASYSIFVLDTTENYLSVLSYWNPDHVYTKQFTRYNVQTQQAGLLGTFSFVSTTSTCGSTKVFQLQLNYIGKHIYKQDSARILLLLVFLEVGFIFLISWLVMSL